MKLVIDVAAATGAEVNVMNRAHSEPVGEFCFLFKLNGYPRFARGTVVDEAGRELGIWTYVAANT